MTDPKTEVVRIRGNLLDPSSIHVEDATGVALDKRGLFINRVEITIEAGEPGTITLYGNAGEVDLEGRASIKVVPLSECGCEHDYLTCSLAQAQTDEEEVRLD